MEIDNIFEPELSAKLADTHLWIRMGTDGKPQLIRVEPMLTAEGEVIPQNVVLFIDEAGPVIMDRDAVSLMLAASTCAPLEKMLNWKHKIKH